MDEIQQLNDALAGRYDILREVGAGGMATVYLARDVRHDRDVAIKVLNREVGAVLGTERFLSEIRVTANLHHPHLLPLFDSGESDGLLYYVMPFIEGETLRGRLDRERQLPVDEALRIAVSVASALDYAHRKGVIHRDLKPENILLDDGHPTVADFGIALAVTRAGGARVTQSGLSLGTPQYMSPEQAAGDRVIDARTDIYSLGAVTYEMLTGEPPHAGRTAQAVIARLMTENPPPISTLRPAISQQIEAAVACALEKLPADRFATAHQFGEALQGKVASGARPARTPWQGDRRARYAAAGGALVVALSLAVAGWALLSRYSTDAPNRPMRFALALPEDAVARIGGLTLGISQDGSSIAYIGGPTREIFVLRLDELSPRRLAGTEGALRPVFSPDGQSIAFNMAGGIRTIPTGGGPITTVVDSAGTFDWQDGTTIIFEKHNLGQLGLWQVNASGGTHERVTAVTPDSDPQLLVEHKRPSMLPGGKALIFALVRAANPGELAAVRLGEGKVIKLGVQGDNAHYLGNGYLAFSRRDGTVAAVAFDPDRLKVSGPEVPIIERVVMSPNGNAAFAVSRSGALFYGVPPSGSSLVEVDRSGKATVLLTDPRRYRLPRISPDGRRIALESIERGPVRLDSDIWIYDRVSRTVTPLTSDRTSGGPAWSPDGRMIAWTKEDSIAPDRTRTSVWWQPWNGSAQARRLAGSAAIPVFFPGGGYVLATVWKGVGRRELTRISLSADTTGTVVLTQVGHPMARISPDGHWIAYVSEVSGRREVYVRSLAGAPVQYQVSVDGGFQPVWSPDGTEIFFGVPGDWLVAAKLQFMPDFTVTRRDSLFEVGLGNGIVAADYDVTGDGNHFVLSTFTGRTAPIVALGWADEVKQRVERASKK